MNGDDVWVGGYWRCWVGQVGELKVRVMQGLGRSSRSKW